MQNFSSQNNKYVFSETCGKNAFNDNKVLRKHQLIVILQNEGCYWIGRLYQDSRNREYLVPF